MPERRNAGVTSGSPAALLTGLVAAVLAFAAASPNLVAGLVAGSLGLGLGLDAGAGAAFLGVAPGDGFSLLATISKSWRNSSFTFLAGSQLSCCLL